MKWLVGFAAKLAVVATIGYALYAVSHLNQRSVTAWTAATPADVGKPVSRGPGLPFAPGQPGVTGAPSCEAQTWPNITPDCITGHAQPLRPAPAAPAQTASVASIAREAPPREPASPARTEPVEPAHTGSLPTAANERIRRPAQAHQASSMPRENRRAVRLRTARHATPRARTRPRPSALYAQRPPRLAEMPWTNRNQSWRDGRPE